MSSLAIDFCQAEMKGDTQGKLMQMPAQTLARPQPCLSWQASKSVRGPGWSQNNGVLS
jgi:hypothetical protein